MKLDEIDKLRSTGTMDIPKSTTSHGGARSAFSRGEPNSHQI